MAELSRISATRHSVRLCLGLIISDRATLCRQGEGQFLAPPGRGPVVRTLFFPAGFRLEGKYSERTTGGGRKSGALDRPDRRSARR